MQVEADAFDALAKMGASPLTRVLTAGGGSVNDKWTAMRQRTLGVPTQAADEVEASFGLALLGLRKYEP